MNRVRKSAERPRLHFMVEYSGSGSVGKTARPSAPLAEIGQSARTRAAWQMPRPPEGLPAPVVEQHRERGLVGHPVIREDDVGPAVSVEIADGDGAGSLLDREGKRRLVGAVGVAQRDG